MRNRRHSRVLLEFLLVQGKMFKAEHMNQSSVGGEDDADDVSSLRRRRRLSSAALGSPSSNVSNSSS